MEWGHCKTGQLVSSDETMLSHNVTLILTKVAFKLWGALTRIGKHLFGAYASILTEVHLTLFHNCIKKDE
jgi:hypothetical protein